MGPSGCASEQAPRHRVLRGEDPVLVKLSWYGPGLRQAAHGHHRGHASFLIAGRLQEAIGAADHQVFSGAVGLRGGGSRHAVVFGPEGALILNVSASWTSSDTRGGTTWRLDGAPGQLLGLLLADPGDDEVLADLESRFTAGAAASPAPPPWLMTARERLSEEHPCSIGRLAEDLGLHRVYFGRAFERWTGTPPSVFRVARMADRAVAAVVSGVPAALAAVDAGFADQSHMSRAVKALTGVPPGRLASLIAGP